VDPIPFHKMLKTRKVPMMPKDDSDRGWKPVDHVCGCPADHRADDGDDESRSTQSAEGIDEHVEETGPKSPLASAGWVVLNIGFSCLVDLAG
jgi:hypothetical protein